MISWRGADQFVRFCAVVLISCSSMPGPEPEFDAGPPDACEIDGGLCPGLARTRCRVDRLLAQASSCTGVDDCTSYRFPPNCLEYGRCPSVAVNFGQEASFSLAASRELNAFCGGTSCRPATTCTETRTPTVACVSGRCVLTFATVDAGVRDGGR
ncbi:MAG: hypothetical protein ABTQ32_35985 [Myxococcaceae bacterium]